MAKSLLFCSPVRRAPRPWCSRRCMSRSAVQITFEKAVERLDNRFSLVARLQFQKSPTHEGINFGFAYLHTKASQTITPALARSAHPHGSWA
jgi:hypothetical protein